MKDKNNQLKTITNYYQITITKQILSLVICNLVIGYWILSGTWNLVIGDY